MAAQTDSKRAHRGGMSKREVQEAVRTRDNFACIHCAMGNEEHVNRYGCQLHVHRTTPGSFYTVDSCVTICVVCHKNEPKRTPGSVDLELTEGVTKPTNYRLGSQVLEQLDSLVESFDAETGAGETRTSVVRQLIHREWVKRNKKGGKP